MIDQTLTMLNMQDAMNIKVNADWRHQGFAWYRAIWTECAELMDHYGWKWWKKQTPDMDHVKLELIDIWHFGLSIELLESNDSIATASRIASDVENTPYSTENFRELLEDFTLNTLKTKSFDVTLFTQLMKSTGMDYDELYVRYMGKNVLNFFRQDNGYQDGSYRKLWQGKEDNEHLSEIMPSLDATSPTFKDDIYNALNSRYSAAE
jgi:dimeric dUTPase (all-alpha-NTP-PPase superfamily)